jgi:predicted  nucleic acid-binding Zn-ribbon protein
MDKCPKCGKKLTILNIKQECPECGCDILYYDIDKRLEEDARQAEKEFETLYKFLDKVTSNFIKNKKK